MENERNDEGAGEKSEAKWEQEKCLCVCIQERLHTLCECFLFFYLRCVLCVS